jgi:hypothetical protein
VRERAVLRAAFAADAELERDTALLVRGLAAIDMERVFMRAFVREVAALQARGAPPGRAVLPALGAVVEAAVSGRA